MSVSSILVHIESLLLSRHSISINALVALCDELVFVDRLHGLFPEKSQEIELRRKRRIKSIAYGHVSGIRRDSEEIPETWSVFSAKRLVLPDYAEPGAES